MKAGSVPARYFSVRSKARVFPFLNVYHGSSASSHLFCTNGVIHKLDQSKVDHIGVDPSGGNINLEPKTHI